MEIKPWDKLAKLLPPLASYEFEELRVSIAEHGVLQPILVLPDGRIIDGCHRWKITGDKTPYDVLNLDEQTAFLLGLVMNTARRQLSQDQIKELRKEQKKIALELRNSGMSQEKVAGILGVTQQTIDKWEGKDISITTSSNAYNPPDWRRKIPEKERQKIKERVDSGESQSNEDLIILSLLEIADNPYKYTYWLQKYNCWCAVNLIKRSQYYDTSKGAYYEHPVGKGLREPEKAKFEQSILRKVSRMRPNIKANPSTKEHGNDGQIKIDRTKITKTAWVNTQKEEDEPPDI